MEKGGKKDHRCSGLIMARVWASFSSKWSCKMKSPGCKLGALFKQHVDSSRHTFQLVYLVTACLRPPLN